MEYATPSEFADRWKISPQRITALCRAGRIPGAFREGREWMIPANAEKPEDGRRARQSAGTAGRLAAGAQRLPLPIGVSSFEEVRTRFAYIDKTLLVKEVLDSGRKATLFLRPRRFGKSLNMDMLRCFFEKRPDALGNQSESGDIFEGTAIWSAGERYRAERGRYPVVFLSFKDAKGRTWDETADAIKRKVSEEYRRHGELRASDALAIEERDGYSRIAQGKASEGDWASSLLDLTRCLQKHHGTAPIVLIDEYDTPIQEGHVRGYYDEVVSFMRMFLSAGLKDNLSLAFACMTGVMRVAKESIFSGLNNLKVDSVLDERYSRFFGFTADETARLLGDYGLSDKAGEARAWYDGHLFGETEIYNPWSIVNYVDERGKPQAYWQKTGSNAVIGDLLAAADESVVSGLQSLMEGGSVTAVVDTSVAYPQLVGNPDAVFSFLLMAGYLRVERNDVLPEGDYLCELRIPNRELSWVYSREILQALPAPGAQVAATGVRHALLTGDAEALERELSGFLYRTASYYDTASEAFFHGMVLGLCAVMEGHYDVRSNRESGRGRFDVMLVPRSAGFPGIVIEVKANSGQSAEDAVRQIEDKDYYAELRARGIDELLGIGISFEGKEVCVRIAPGPALS